MTYEYKGNDRYLYFSTVDLDRGEEQIRRAAL